MLRTYALVSEFIRNKQENIRKLLHFSEMYLFSFVILFHFLCFSVCFYLLGVSKCFNSFIYFSKFVREVSSETRTMFCGVNYIGSVEVKWYLVYQTWVGQSENFLHILTWINLSKGRRKWKCVISFDRLDSNQCRI